jgi:hypothetical protein
VGTDPEQVLAQRSAFAPKATFQPEGGELIRVATEPLRHPILEGAAGDRVEVDQRVPQIEDHRADHSNPRLSLEAHPSSFLICGHVRVFSTCSFLSQARRAWPTPSSGYASARVECASLEIESSTPASPAARA